MKTIILVGGAGTIGQVLAKHLATEYNVRILDQKNPNLKHSNIEYVETDALNKEDLLNKIPPNATALLNLLNTNTRNSLEEEQFEHMTNIFFRSSFYVLQAAAEKKIPKVVFASSNHVTDFYEEEGHSLLGREITTEDIPKSKGLYGVLKFASEQLGFLFSEHKQLSVINLRIGTFPKETPKEAIFKHSRVQHTLLTEQDLVQLFRLALKSNRKYGTYYAVSDNEGKPWSTQIATDDLHYRSLFNAQDVLNK
ncbi:NAD-dependent epimerase/dehydratase family protein [Alkalicoccobacillus plakortidis]|uniref:NAD(P)-dependent oxidoreductase n=1 Tax=Alkalicoccobacillus plakortidis TaxID=444060 RepID=A0ABT0XKN0_9BACI|nr:NAD(P)-dependent oxidoreductase [Alkalicoccobacillus plakortidis]MCM2676290.1 NAD(P)-dependent oxidoreductase [Alkalicoccobacillus plakortidis]